MSLKEAKRAVEIYLKRNPTPSTFKDLVKALLTEMDQAEIAQCNQPVGLYGKGIGQLTEEHIREKLESMGRQND